jgi:hypothetical protein
MDSEYAVPQGLETVIQMELWSRFQTGNVLMDTMIRTLFLGLLVGFISSIMAVVKDDVLYPVAGKVKDLVWNRYRGRRKYTVTLEGQSKMNSFMGEKYVFSVEFKAVLDAILMRKPKVRADDVRSLIQFNNSADVKYDNVAEITKTEYSYSYILDQRSHVRVTDSLFARIEVEKKDPATNEKATKGLESKIYRIELGSDTTTCEDIVKWIEETTSTYSSRRAEELNSKRYLAKFRGCDSEDGRAKWDTDVLTSNPSFDSLFFEGKDEIVNTIKRFLKEKEFYESVGKPWQLGINLSGPPGCGKTSFIRVVASMLNRNIKDISFSKIKTNKDFEEAIRCVEYEGKQLSPDKTIIVAEDIDCANMDVIRSRNGSSASNSECGSVCDDLHIGSGPSVEKNEASTTTVASLVNALAETSRIEREQYVKTAKATKSEQDTLDLSTILNIMDGIQSSNGRIIILTTNHPEKIDSALLRPGRIDINIRLGELSVELIYDMCYHWYSKYSEFYKDIGILERFVNGWNDTCEGYINNNVLRPCIVHNILQKNGKNVEAALVDLRFACNQQ